MDHFDLQILRELQADAEISMQELGERVGLSHTPCWRRVKKLEDAGVIRRRVTLLDPERLSLTVNVFVQVSLGVQREGALNDFEAAVQTIPEIVECYTVSGDRDFLLRVVVEDVSAYERLLKTTLVHLPEVANMSSTFALRQVKYTTELPLGSSQPPAGEEAATG
jgi:Lrp/AsnC family transcriptional regulator